jgi:hypothetical protein
MAPDSQAHDDFGGNRQRMTSPKDKPIVAEFLSAPLRYSSAPSFSNRIVQAILMHFCFKLIYQ